jgi:hypothetical protein
MTKHFDTQAPFVGVVMERAESLGGAKALSLSVATPAGFVEVDITRKDTTLSFIWGGILYRRVIDRAYKRAFAVTVAKRFAMETLSNPSAAAELFCNACGWQGSSLDEILDEVPTYACPVCSRPILETAYQKPSGITWVDSGPVVPAVNASDCSLCSRSTTEGA